MEMEQFLSSSGWDDLQSNMFCYEALAYHDDPDLGTALTWQGATLCCLYDIGSRVDVQKVRPLITKLEETYKKLAAMVPKSDLEDVEFKLHYALFKGYSLLGSPREIVHYFGLTQLEKGFGWQVGQAYANPPRPDELAQVSIDSAPPVFMAAIPFKPDILLRLKYFLQSSSLFHANRPDEDKGLFFGYFRDLAAPPVTLIDSILAVMHEHLPQDRRMQAKFAEWWTHVRPDHTRQGNGTLRGHDCHTDDSTSRNVGHLAIATSILYLVDGSEATLVTNIKNFEQKDQPLAWVVPPRMSISTTFPSSWVHCVLPTIGVVENPARVSINVMWLKGACTEQSGGDEGDSCVHRPSEGWAWEAEIQAEHVLQTGSSPLQSVIVPSSVPLYEDSRGDRPQDEL